MKKKSKAIAMVSGGLDSTIAIEMMKKQGVEIHGINFNTGFCITNHKRKINRKDIPLKKMRNEALRASADTQIPMEIIDLSEDYMENVIMSPKHGYGAGLNPCTDCRIYMLKKAKQIMEEKGADFVFTGEVLAQRPKSQKKFQLNIIEKESGLEGKLLRPLSAKHLSETIPEKDGIINRDQLESIHGRSRKRQIELADQLQVLDYPQPAGGCCSLPDQIYSGRLLDLIRHQDKITQEDSLLLKVGRHFRINDYAKLIVGRDELENNFLAQYKKDKVMLEVLDYSSPISLLVGHTDEQAIMIAGQITIRYSDAPKSDFIKFSTITEGNEKILSAKSMDEEVLKNFKIQPKNEKSLHGVKKLSSLRKSI